MKLCFQFLGWLHRDANAVANFLKINTNNSSIVLTRDHLIFRTSVADGSLESVFADQIEEGNKLRSWKGSKVTEEAVVDVEQVREKSIWAPLTMEGTFLIDGLLASSYASISHEAYVRNFERRKRRRKQDLVLAPVKIFPRLLLDVQQSQQQDGYRPVMKLMILMLKLMLMLIC